jgi:hypothetical protein
VRKPVLFAPGDGLLLGDWLAFYVASSNLVTWTQEIAAALNHAPAPLWVDRHVDYLVPPESRMALIAATQSDGSFTSLAVRDAPNGRRPVEGEGHIAGMGVTFVRRKGRGAPRLDGTVRAFRWPEPVALDSWLV